jgi:hypothetical protein
MQAPAVTREYPAALLQLVRSAEQEIAQRKASAERFYGIAASTDEDRFLAQPRAVESMTPANGLGARHVASRARSSNAKLIFSNKLSSRQS